MEFQLSLKNRVYLVNAILLVITVIGAVVLIWYTFKIEKIFKDIVEEDLVVYQSAEALANSLVSQKGFVSYYLLERDPSWLDELDMNRKLFSGQLEQVKALAGNEWEKKAVRQIQDRYRRYVATKDQVIELYRKSELEKGRELHKTVREDFSQILELCEQFKAFHKVRIADAVKMSQKQSNQLRYAALVAILTVVVLILLINYIFARHILEPIRRLAEEADRLGVTRSSSDEVTALKQSVHGLIENAAQTHEELRQSRETLMQSEKMVLLGKLAAGTAHSIRNPLTSVKMRLFSLNRSSNFTPDQQEDFSVISGEITQINRIVENFLEFSRPPKLKKKRVSLSAVVDSALHLLEQRLKSYRVTIRLVRRHPISETFIDPEQFKEVLVNIIINACEAFENGGIITIHEEEKRTGDHEKAAVIKIIDDGPGIPQDIEEEIFNPFFTTKESGTGLGLSIAFNIINEHGGWLDVESGEDRGTSFIITIPIKERENEHHTGN